MWLWLCLCVTLFYAMSAGPPQLPCSLRSVYTRKDVSLSTSASPQDALPTSGCACLSVQRELSVWLPELIFTPYSPSSGVVVVVVYVDGGGGGSLSF